MGVWGYGRCGRTIFVTAETENYERKSQVHAEGSFAKEAGQGERRKRQKMGTETAREWYADKMADMEALR